MKHELSGITLDNFIIRENISHGGQGSIYSLEPVKPMKMEYILKVSTKQTAIEIECEMYNKFRTQLKTFIPELFYYTVKSLSIDSTEYFYLIIEKLDTTLTKKHKNSAKSIYNSLLIVLQMIHNMGYVHHDIKPQNIMFRKNSNKPVLIDLGLMIKYYPSDYQSKFFGTKYYSSVYTLLTGTYCPIDDYISLCWTMLSLFQTLPWKIPNGNLEQKDLREKVALFQYSWIQTNKDTVFFANIVNKLMNLPHSFLSVPDISTIKIIGNKMSMSNDSTFKLMNSNVLDIFKVNCVESTEIDWKLWDEQRVRSLIDYLVTVKNEYYEIMSDCYRGLKEYINGFFIVCINSLNNTIDQELPITIEIPESERQIVFKNKNYLYILDIIKTHIFHLYYVYQHIISDFMLSFNKKIKGIREAKETSEIINLTNGEVLRKFIEDNKHTVYKFLLDYYEYYKPRMAEDINANLLEDYLNNLYNMIIETNNYEIKVLELLENKFKGYVSIC